MTQDKNNAAVWLLINDALDASGGKPPLAAMLLVDAVASIVVSRLNGAGAVEMAGMLSQHLHAQIDAGLKAKDNA